MLIDKLKNFNIILASQSPRRTELLSLMKLNFSVADPYEVEEICPPSIMAEEAGWYISRLKAEKYPKELQDNDLLITADTLVILDEVIYGKPKDRQDAINILKKLSGKTHKVITGVTLKTKNTIQSFSEVTDVTFRSLSEEEIIYYVDNFAPYDKAGAYAVQEWIGVIGVSNISGSYFNIMGLPTDALYRQLLLLLNKIK